MRSLAFFTAAVQLSLAPLPLKLANTDRPAEWALGSINEEHFDSIFDGNVKGLAFTVQKSSAALAGCCVDHPHFIHSRQQGSNSLLRPHLDHSSQRAKDSVNAVSPVAADTEGMRELLGSAQAGQDRIKCLSSAVPMGRLGTPDVIAKAALFLAPADSSYVTGAKLFVDGGFAQV